MQKKIAARLFFFTCFILFLATATEAVCQSTNAAPEPPPPSNIAPDIESLTIDRSVVYLKCRQGCVSGRDECESDKARRVEVRAVGRNKENDILIISYEVKTGRILGQGSHVYWDLAGSVPGTHTITAYADDGGGPIGRRMTKTVEVRSCPKCAQAEPGGSEHQSLVSPAELTVDKDAFYLPCEYKIDPKYRSCPDGMTTLVRTRVPGQGGKPLTYEYTVSVGTIIGTGPTVSWDLSKVQPGTYQIDVRVYKGSTEIGSRTTKIVRVEKCVDCYRECLDLPKASLTSSAPSVNSGGVVAFGVTVEGDAANAYIWKVTNGEILSGQGTANITVRAKSTDAEENILAEVTVTGEDRCIKMYPQTATAIVKIVRGN